MHRLSLGFLLFAALAPAAPASAATKIPEGICPFRAAKIEQAFTPALRRDYGRDEIRETFERRERWYGACSSATPLGGHAFRLHYASAEILLEVQLEHGKIEQFGFEQPEIQNDSWEKLNAFFKAEWPGAGYFVSDEGRDHGFRETEFLPAADGRVLLLAAAVEKAITDGRLRNDQQVKLEARDKAQEIDDLASEKPGFALTVGELKGRVFSRLDRTAADVLLRLVGRDALEAGRAPAAPFLSRREFAWLMTMPAPDLAKVPRESLVEAAAKLDRPGQIPPLPTERYDQVEKAEWRATSRELCEALSGLRALPELKDGLASRNFRREHPSWGPAVYHAAREFGVAQTAFVADLPGRKTPTCVSLLLHSAGFLDEDAVSEIFSRITTLLVPRR
jgi:hypothetical protein